MTRPLKYFLLLVFTGLSTVAFTQNEAKKWYFGNNGALDFTTNPPTSLANGAMTTPEGCASIADASGNLLFYTNGIRIWNQSHAVMANGTGLLGESNGTQAALIVKQPGSTSLYIVFTTDGGSNGLRYSVVDMSLASGAGSVTAKNVLVYAPSTERLCGTKHCNGKDVWVISHEPGSNVFRANLVTAAGVNTTGVVSATGSNMNSTGCLKASPNGRKLGTALYSLSSFELYDFDASTGVVSNPLTLPSGALGYGCEFSPDGTKFYGCVVGENSTTNRLRQWDLCAGSNQAILASASSFNATHTGQLQLAPDGKIYQARALTVKKKMSPEVTVEYTSGEPALGVIHNPNAGPSSLNFNNTGQFVNPALSLYGLPNFVSGFYKTPVAQFSYSINPAINCVEVLFTAPPLITATCSATSYTASSVKWLFGDPASGPSDSSALVNPSHIYPNIGTYDARLILYNSCGGVIDTVKQKVLVGSALVNNGTTFSVCLGQSLALVASGPSTYSWSTGATTSSIVVSPTVNTTYSLSFTDSFGCQYKSVQTVTVNPPPAVIVSGKDSVCFGGSVALKVSGALSYSWSTGSTNSAITVTPAVTTPYTVTGSSFEGCNVSKVFTVVVKPAPVPVITANTLVCEGSPATATATSGSNGTFYWNIGVYGPTVTLVPDWNLGYVFSVKASYANGCTNFSRVRFNIKPVPNISIAGSTSLCLGSVITLTAGGASTYSWSSGSMTNTTSLSPPKDTSYTVVGTDTNNCVSTSSVLIKVNPTSPASAFVFGGITICEGESAFLSASGGKEYSWNPTPELLDTSTRSVVVSPSVSTVYSVTISTDSTCATTKTVMVSVNPKPRLWTGRDTTFNLQQPMIITAAGNGTVTWIGGEGIDCPGCRSIQVFPILRTCYLAQAVSDSDCIALDEVCVDVGAEYAVYVPNAFTPNSDGINDELFVSGFGISEVHLTIFNRWGEKIFTSDSEKDGWNGSSRGSICPEGIYNWLLEYVLADGQKQRKTGYVTLFR